MLGYLRGAILTHGEAKRNLEFIGGDHDRQLQQLWAETKIGDIMPWEDVEGEAERLLDSARANEQDSEDSHVSQEQDDDRTADRDEIDPYNEVICGRRRPDSVAIEWTSKTLYILEFKRTSDQRQDYRERGESRARDQHDPTAFHQFSSKSLQSFEDFFHLALLTATVSFRTRSLCKI